MSSRERQRAVWELAWAILAGVALGFAITFAPAFVSASERLYFPRYDAPPSDVAQSNARALMNAGFSWQLAHPGECPTVARVRADGALQREWIAFDPWSRPYILFCPHDDDLGVVSAGADGLYGTADDIRLGAAQ